MQTNNNNNNKKSTISRSWPKRIFYAFSIMLFSLLALICSLFLYQTFYTKHRLAFHAHKTEAYYLYSIIASRYDKIINPWHWTIPMRDFCFDDARLPTWARWNKTAPAVSNNKKTPFFSETNKMKIVDVGAGTGFTTIGVIQATNPKTTEITMLDQSNHQLAEAQKKPILNNTKKILGDSHFLPFDNETFHRWTSAGSVEYWSDPSQVYREAFRVLQPGGVAITIGPARPTHWLAKQLADLWYLFPQASEYKMWHQKAGFEEVQVIELNPEWYGPTDRQYGLIMGYVIAARKAKDGKPVSVHHHENDNDKHSVEFLNSDIAEISPSVAREQNMQTQEDSSIIQNILSIIRFGLGGIGALYYTFLPIFIALKTTGWGVGDNYPELISPPEYLPAIGVAADYLFGLIVAELIWIFVAAHLDVPENANKQNSPAITLRSVYRLARPHTIKGTLVATVIGYLLAATFTLNYTEHLVTGLHILTSGLAVNIYIVALNQLTDIEIDIENGKPLPIVTGDLSWNNAKHITHVSFLIASSLALGGVGATWWILVVMLLAVLGTLYSIPPYRLKQWSSSAAACIALARGVVAIVGGVATLLEVFKVDAEDLTNFPVWPMGFTFSAILLIFCTVIAISKDVPDVLGDKKANINTLAIRVGSANLMKISFFTLIALYASVIGIFTSSTLSNLIFGSDIPYRIDVVSLVAFHLTACVFLIKSFFSNGHWSKLEDKNLCVDLYINCIWSLFYFELIAFPVPCLIETLRYRHVIAASSDSVQTSLAVFISVIAPLFLASYAREQIQRFLCVAEKIHQVKSIKNKICQHVLNDKDLFSKHCPALLNDEEKIFDTDAIKQETEKLFASVNNNDNNNKKSKTIKTQLDQDRENVRQEITKLVGLEDLGIFHDAAGHVFKNPGKMIRSRIITLLARTLAAAKSNDKNNTIIIDQSLVLAVCTEMSHSASLLHDDVVDESDTRRGSPSTSKTFGNKLAILAGDFLFSRALRHLTVHVGIEEVTSNTAQVLENLTFGEIIQISPNGNQAKFNSNNDDCYDEVLGDVLDRYRIKCYLKTASLFALTCKSTACIAIEYNKNNNNIKESSSSFSSSNLKYYAEAFGRHFGMAFQMIDDLYDYDEEKSSEAAVGKPVGQDLKLGLATLPVILAAKSHPRELLPLILRNFSREGDVERAMSFVHHHKTVKDDAKKFVEDHIKKAIGCLLHFPKSDWRDELVELVGKYKLY